MDISGCTAEHACKLKIKVEKSTFFTMAQADHKIEIEMDIDGQHTFYQTTFSDLWKILSKADNKLSQSRIFAPFEV